MQPGLRIAAYPFCDLMLSPVTIFFPPSQPPAGPLPQDGVPPAEIPSGGLSLPEGTLSFTSSLEPTSSEKTPMIFHRAEMSVFYSFIEV